MIELLEDAFAAYRLTRLATTDYGPPPLSAARDATRSFLTGRLGPKWAEVVDCPWCAGVYVGAGVMLARRFLPAAWSPVARALALAGAASYLINAER